MSRAHASTEENHPCPDGRVCASVQRFPSTVQDFPSPLNAHWGKVVWVQATTPLPFSNCDMCDLARKRVMPSLPHVEIVHCHDTNTWEKKLIKKVREQKERRRKILQYSGTTTSAGTPHRNISMYMYFSHTSILWRAHRRRYQRVIYVWCFNKLPHCNVIHILLLSYTAAAVLCKTL